MRNVIAILSLVGLIHSTTTAQVKSNYLYNTAMPYGTLDIRTSISSTNYYYLQEGKTFAYRESSPGVRTYKYRDMTSWESNPYLQGNLRYKNGTSDKFVMNYRLLMPLNYNSSYSPGYPLIVIMHGAVERGNCYYNQCFHSDWNYDPNVNSPRAPTTVDHKLLNNDYQLSIAGKEHLDARNLAAGKLPNDATLSTRAFPGFVLVCQMFNEWSAPSVQDMIRVVRLHLQKYRIDQNKVYIHGLSIGGYAVYEAVIRAPWLFAAALPMSASYDANLLTLKYEGKVQHVGWWMFQGGLDTTPTPAYTNNVVTKLRNGGAIVKYTVYSDLSHQVWNRAYADASFYSWMRSRDISNLHLYKGNAVIKRSTSVYPKLILPEGFYGYQWQRNGVAITGSSNTYTATVAGTYRARFSRDPALVSWNRWSNNVVITESTTTTTSFDSAIAVVDDPAERSIEVYPNPTSSDNLNIEYGDDINAAEFDPNVRMKFTLIDALGRTVYEEDFTPDGQSRKLGVQNTLNDGLYILMIENGERTIKKRVLIRNDQ